MHVKLGMVGAMLLAVSAIRCTGTETDNPVGPVKSFQTTGCHGPVKNPAPPSTGAGGTGSLGTLSVYPAPAELQGDPTYNHLSCVIWSRSGDEVVVLLRNMRAGCGADYERGAARFVGSELRLEAQGKTCDRSACGYCHYDLEWSVTDAPEADLGVSYFETDFASESCGSDEPSGRFVIPAGDNEGAHCSFTEYFNRPAPDCSLHSACGGGIDAYCTCQEGTRCSDTNGGRCLTVCTDDADCPVPGAFDCTEGLCHPRPW